MVERGEEERLVCIDPAETRAYRIGGGTFKLGVLPRDIYGRFLKAKKDLDFEDFWEAVRHGVQGHEGLVYPDGKPVLFKQEKDRRGRLVVSEETMGVYHATGIVTELASEVFTKGGGPRTRRLMEEALSGSRATEASDAAA
jgi:hypothetical protein